MKQVFLLFSFFYASFSFGQTNVFTISTGPNVNVTLSTPFRPLLGGMDANLNVTTLLNELSTQDVIIDDNPYVAYEIVVIDDVHYSQPFDLSISCFNSSLLYADVKNDSTGSISISGLSAVILGTDLSWLLAYPLSPLPVATPPVVRSVEVGSSHGSTLLDGAVYVSVLAPVSPTFYAQLGRNTSSNLGSIQVYAGNYVVVQAGGNDSYAMIGHGGPNNTDIINANIFINVEEGNIYVQGNGNNAYAQIGHRNVVANPDIADFTLEGSIMIHAFSVPVNIPMSGNIFVTGGAGSSSESLIGHHHQSNESTINVDGSIEVNPSSNLILKSGSGFNASARVGHFVSCAEQAVVSGEIAVIARFRDVFLDALSNSAPTKGPVQIGHEALSFGLGVGASCHNDIYIVAGRYISCIAGDDGFERHALLGHLAPDPHAFISGQLDINAGDSILIRSDLGHRNMAQIGHLNDPLALGGFFEGDISIRNQDKQIYTSLSAHDFTSHVRVGHLAQNVVSNVTLLTSGDIELYSTSSGIAGASAGAWISAWDTLRISAGDSVLIQSGTVDAFVEALAPDAFVSIDAKSTITFNTVFPALANAILAGSDARLLRCRSGDDLQLSNHEIFTNLLDGEIWLEADKDFQDGELFDAQYIRDGTSGPFDPLNLAAPSTHKFADTIGAVVFNNSLFPTSLETQNGNIFIRSKSMSINSTLTHLTISNSILPSTHLQTQSGTILIGMGLNPGNQPISLGDSYESAHIEDYNILQSIGRFYLNVNDSIHVINSTLKMNDVLLFTN